MGVSVFFPQYAMLLCCEYFCVRTWGVVFMKETLEPSGANVGVKCNFCFSGQDRLVLCVCVFFVALVAVVSLFRWRFSHRLISVDVNCALVAVLFLYVYTVVIF